MSGARTSEDRPARRAGVGKHVASVALILTGGLWCALVAILLFALLALSAETRRVGDHSFPWLTAVFMALWLLPGIAAMIGGVAMVRQMYPSAPSEPGHG